MFNISSSGYGNRMETKEMIEKILKTILWIICVGCLCMLVHAKNATEFVILLILGLINGILIHLFDDMREYINEL
jgi:hypothetical protein